MTGIETAAVWKEFHGRLLAYILKRVNSREDAEDILQEVFLRIHARLTAGAEIERLDAWLFRITRNAVIDYYRVRSRNPEQVLPDMETDTAGPAQQEPPGESQEIEARRELARCVNPLARLLPPNYRRAIQMVELGGLESGAAARRLGISVSGMKSRVQRGRRKLKAVFEECCRIETNRHGLIQDYESRSDSCSVGNSRGEGARNECK